MATLTIKKADGTSVSLPEPTELEVTIQDLDSDKSGRNQNGKLFRDRIAIKRKLKINFPPLTDSDMHKVLNALTDVFFDITYPDPLTGKNRTMEAYVGDRTAPIMLINNGSAMWDEMSISLTER
jgi:hypothetical protein